jgi:hypothetical protein
MVAAANAGAKPIPYKLLNSNNLAEAIQFCLTEEAAYAAEQMALRMRAENGVKTAVDSFHRCLPTENLRCDVLSDQSAAWTYKKAKRSINLSHIAANILTECSRLDPKSLKQ